MKMNINCIKNRKSVKKRKTTEQNINRKEKGFYKTDVDL